MFCSSSLIRSLKPATGITAGDFGNKVNLIAACGLAFAGER